MNPTSKALCEPSELPVKLSRSLVISSLGKFNRFVAPQIDALPINLDLRPVHPGPSLKPNAFHSELVLGKGLAIHHVLGVRANSNVVTLAVKGVVILVINQLPLLRAQKEPMQQGIFPANLGARVEVVTPFGRAILLSAPRVARDEVGVCVINQRNQSMFLSMLAREFQNDGSHLHRPRFFGLAARTTANLSATLRTQHLAKRGPVSFRTQFFAEDASDMLNGWTFVDRRTAVNPVGDGVRLLAKCVGESLQTACQLDGAAHRFRFGLGVCRFHAHKYTRGVSFAQDICEFTL